MRGAIRVNQLSGPCDRTPSAAKWAENSRVSRGSTSGGSRMILPGSLRNALVRSCRATVAVTPSFSSSCSVPMEKSARSSRRRDRRGLCGGSIAGQPAVQGLFRLS